MDMTVVCQTGTAMMSEEEKPCAGPQWEAPRYFFKTRAALLFCEKHAKLSMEINPPPFGTTFRRVKDGARPLGYDS